MWPPPGSCIKASPLMQPVAASPKGDLNTGVLLYSGFVVLLAGYSSNKDSGFVLLTGNTSNKESGFGLKSCCELNRIELNLLFDKKYKSNLKQKYYYHLYHKDTN